MHPKARQAGFTVQDVAGELVIYDEKRHRVHNLNSTAARVWRLCDGATSEAEVARHLAEETNMPVDEALVRFTLAELARAKLLEVQPATEDLASFSRRQFMRQAVIAAGLALPIITSMVASTPVRAQGGNEGPRGKDECSGDYKLQKIVPIIGTGKDCDEAQKSARKAAFVFADQKCEKRKCPGTAKCTSFTFTAKGSCKNDGKTAIWTWAVEEYSCGCK